MAQSDIHVSPAQLAHYLRGVQFPASKQDLKADAQKNQAPPEVLKFIDELPGRPARSGKCCPKAVAGITIGSLYRRQVSSAGRVIGEHLVLGSISIECRPEWPC